jgi:hypothetical protein
MVERIRPRRPQLEKQPGGENLSLHLGLKECVADGNDPPPVAPNAVQ